MPRKQNSAPQVKQKSEKSKGGERGGENNGVNNGHYVIHQRVQVNRWRTHFARTKNQHPRLTRNPRKVRRVEEEREITVLIEATTFATQPVYNAARSVHALRSDQYVALYDIFHLRFLFLLVVMRHLAQLLLAQMVLVWEQLAVALTRQKWTAWEVLKWQSQVHQRACSPSLLHFHYQFSFWARQSSLGSKKKNKYVIFSGLKHLLVVNQALVKVFASIESQQMA